LEIGARYVEAGTEGEKMEVGKINPFSKFQQPNQHQYTTHYHSNLFIIFLFLQPKPNYMPNKFAFGREFMQFHLFGNLLA